MRRIDEIFAIERDVNGLSTGERLAARETRLAPLVTALEEWMRTERVRLSRHAEVAKAMDYMLKRWPAFIRFLYDGRSVSAIMPRSARCAASRSDAGHGCSLVPIAEVSEPRR